MQSAYFPGEEHPLFASCQLTLHQMWPFCHVPEGQDDIWYHICSRPSSGRNCQACPYKNGPNARMEDAWLPVGEQLKRKKYHLTK